MLIQEQQAIAQRASEVDRIAMFICGHSVCELELLRLDGALSDQELRQIMNCAIQLAEVELESRGFAQ